MGQERRRNERISRAFRRPEQARPLRRAREVAAWKHEPAALPSQRSLLRSAVGHVVDGHRREVRSGEHRAGARGQVRDPLRRGGFPQLAPRSKRPLSWRGGECHSPPPAGGTPPRTATMRIAAGLSRIKKKPEKISTLPA